MSAGEQELVPELRPIINKTLNTNGWKSYETQLPVGTRTTLQTVVAASLYWRKQLQEEASAGLVPSPIRLEERHSVSVNQL